MFYPLLTSKRRFRLILFVTFSFVPMRADADESVTAFYIMMIIMRMTIALYSSKDKNSYLLLQVG